MSHKLSYLVLGDFKLSHLLFLVISPNVSVLVCGFRPNRLFKVTSKLAKYFGYRLDFFHLIFDDIFLEGECLYQYSSRLTIDICNEYYSSIFLKKHDSNLPFLRFILLKHFRKNYSSHVSVVRKVISFSFLKKSKFPNHKLLLQCEDSFFLQHFSYYQKHIDDIRVCSTYSSFFNSSWALFPAH